MANQMKKLDFAPVKGYISSVLKNSWSTAKLSPIYKDKCFDFQNVRHKSKEWRGCIANRDIKAGEILVSIPWNSVIAVKATNKHTDEVLACSLYRNVFKATKGSTVWKEYINLLPSNEELNGSLFWDDCEINELQLQESEKIAINEARERLQVQEKGIMEVIKLDDSDDVISDDDIIEKRISWCQRIVYSRSFSIGDKLQWRCLLPVADLFNHQPESPWTQTMLEKKGLLSNPCKLKTMSRGKPLCIEVKCIADTKIGSEILIPYGCETNLELLQSYGFILPSSMMNEAQYVPLFRDMTHLVSYCRSEQAISDSKVEAVMNMDASEAPLAIRPGGMKHSGHLIGCVMFLLNEHVAFEEKMNNDVGHYVLSPSTSTNMQQQALRFIAQRCDEILKAMPTTVEADRVMFEESGSDGGVKEERMRLALEYRIQVKELLLSSMTWAH